LSAPDTQATVIPFFKRLKVRVITSFGAVVLLPFVLSMIALYHIAQDDVVNQAGSSLVDEASYLAGYTESELERMDHWAKSLAGEHEVIAHLLNDQPYPSQLFNSALRLQPLALAINIEKAEQDADLNEREIVLEDFGNIIVRRRIASPEGVVLGVLQVDFSSDVIFAGVEGYKNGHRGAATLQSPAGILATSAGDVALVPVEALWGIAGWDVVEEDGKKFYVGEVPVCKGKPDIVGNWRIAVLIGEERVFADFNFAALQVFFMLLALVFMVIALAWRMVDGITKPIMKIKNGAEIISHINLGYRLKVDTGDELEQLSNEFNHMAESLQGAYGELEERVAQINHDLEDERNHLATLLRTMGDAVILINDETKVLLMNLRAKALLSTGPVSGIGTSLGRLLPAKRLDYYIRRVRDAWDEGGEAVERIIFPCKEGGKLLRGVISAIPNAEGERAGYLLLLRDVTQDANRERDSEHILRELPAKLKGPVATIRSMVEILNRRCDLDPERHATFLAALSEESERTIEVLEELELASPDFQFVRWPIQPVDPKMLVEDSLRMEPGIFGSVNIPDTPFPLVAVEPFGWLSALCAVLRWVIKKSNGLIPVEVRLGVEEDSVVLTYKLNGEVDTDPGELDAIVLEQPDEESVPLKVIVRNNRAALWARQVEDGLEVRLAMTKASVIPDHNQAPRLVDDQVEFYDFDIFAARPGIERQSQLETNLTDLEFVVFDTETTGLNPSGGDRIISISGVRVRGGKVLKVDTFHSLVDPRMEIPAESIKIHGITQSMVEDAPTIRQVLPQFNEWVGNAVLVAHNAAFDMKMLEVSTEGRELPILSNPVLDTLFLSYGAHRDLVGHSLDAMADRMGIVIEGRHTSLGDAIATAEILVRLIPILENRGVRTLAEAKRFCDKMLLLKWQSSRF
jgi:DNA polymerase-3 subunit epsilon